MAGLSLKNWHEDLLSQVKRRNSHFSSHANLQWLKDLQEEQINNFIAQGLPTRQNEDWHYTDLLSLKEYKLQLDLEYLNSQNKNKITVNLNSDDLSPSPIDIKNKNYLCVFVNGCFNTELSNIENLPQGVRLTSIAELLKQDPEKIKPYLLEFSEKSQYFACLNTALLSDGLFLYIPNNVCIEKPIIIKSLININNSLCNTGHIRHIIIGGENSNVTVFEQYKTYSDFDSKSNFDLDVLNSKNFYFNTAVTQIYGGKNSVIHHCKLQDESKYSYHMGYITVNQEQGSSAYLHNFSLGGCLARENVEINLNAPETSCQLNGLYILDNQQHMDQHVLVNHYSGNSNSEQLYKGIVGGDGVAVFNGRIAVHPGAQKSNAKQANQNILLSKSGLVNTKPEFEIYADDVQCSHGATVGNMDENALFYLRARGLNTQESMRLLISAFSSSILNKISMPSIKEKISDQVNKKISGIKNNVK